MNELNDAQYLQLQARVNNIPWEQLEKFLSWTYKGRSLSINDFPGATANRQQQINDFFKNRPNPLEQQEWAEIQKCNSAQTLSDYQLLAAKLGAYINRWSLQVPSGSHIAEAKAVLQDTNDAIVEYTRKLEESEWEKVDYFNISSLEVFYKKFPHTLHKDDIDNGIFGLAKSMPLSDLVAALNRYKTIFPDGLHIAEIDAIINAALRWNNVRNSGDIYTVFSYIKDYPTSSFLNDAEMLLMELKGREIARMKKEFNDYPRTTLLDFVNRGIFPEHELIYNEVATDRSLEILRNYSEIREGLPVLDDIIPQCSTECFPDHTDIFMFGIPATGKSCILAGLLGTDALNYDSVVSGGPYADALSNFIECNCPPDPTKKNYLTAIKAQINVGSRVHLFDLVEMAGEEFAEKISNNPEGHISFEDMGTGATELLKTENKKIFFIIVDPTKNVIRFTTQEEHTDANGNVFYTPKTIIINQKNSLKRMVDLFNQPENENVMRKVDAIHFIVTKADTLGDTYDEREEKTAELLRKTYGNAIRTLKEICEKYGINRATNGVPHAFPFSLGRFYVGNIFEYDDTDSNIILGVMKGNTGAIRKETFYDKFKKVMNNGF